MVTMENEKQPFNNLTSVVQSLPAESYFKSEIYESELNAVWYRNWIYAGRSDEIENTGDYKAIKIGSQNILILRDTDNSIKGFFNTCRHRGSILCTAEHGHLGTHKISCPYHRWTYALDGRLVRTPNLTPTDDFNASSYSLYPVAIEQWGGSIFVNLAGENASGFRTVFSETLFPEAVSSETTNAGHDRLAAWPLEELKVVHSYENRLHCNWKIFWENFVECYHCPGIHPGLCDLVPIYKRSFLCSDDEPDWERHGHKDDPKYRGGLKPGAASWTMDGKIHGVPFPGISKEDREMGYVYLQNLPSMFIVAHLDYVRIVSVLPDGPEHIQLKAQWLLSEASLAKKDLDLSKIVDFGLLVLKEDTLVCEINQQGVQSIAHKNGVLMPQEYDVANFHRWLRVQTGERKIQER